MNRLLLLCCFFCLFCLCHAVEILPLTFARPTPNECFLTNRIPIGLRIPVELFRGEDSFNSPEMCLMVSSNKINCNAIVEPTDLLELEVDPVKVGTTSIFAFVVSGKPENR
jgi:hypothetical protein